MAAASSNVSVSSAPITKLGFRCARRQKVLGAAAGTELPAATLVGEGVEDWLILNIAGLDAGVYPCVEQIYQKIHDDDHGRQ